MTWYVLRTSSGKKYLLYLPVDSLESLAREAAAAQDVLTITFTTLPVPRSYLTELSITVSDEEKMPPMWHLRDYRVETCPLCGAKNALLMFKFESPVHELVFAQYCLSCRRGRMIRLRPLAGIVPTIEEFTWPIEDFELSELRLEDLDPLAYRLAYGKFISKKLIRELIETLTLEQKIYIAKKIIRIAVETAETYNGNGGDWKIAVAYSGGISSTVLLHLVLEELRDKRDRVIAVFENTGLEYPEQEEYVLRICKILEVPVAIVRCKLSPLDLWEIFGIPDRSNIGEKGEYDPVCRVVLKKLAAYYAYRKLNVKVFFTGVQAEESYARLDMADRMGLVSAIWSFAGIKLQRPFITALPLALFKRDELRAYLLMHRIPISPVYDKYRIERQGCAICPCAENLKERLEVYREILGEDQFQRFLKLLENGKKQPKLKTPELIKLVKNKLGLKKLDDLYTIEIVYPDGRREVLA